MPYNCYCVVRLRVSRLHLNEVEITMKSSTDRGLWTRHEPTVTAMEWSWCPSNRLPNRLASPTTWDPLKVKFKKCHATCPNLLKSLLLQTHTLRASGLMERTSTTPHLRVFPLGRATTSGSGVAARRPFLTLPGRHWNRPLIWVPTTWPWTTLPRSIGSMTPTWTPMAIPLADTLFASIKCYSRLWVFI